MAPWLPRLAPFLAPLRSAGALALPWSISRPLSSPSTQTSGPSVTRYLLRSPASSAPRECPTPLVFVRAKGLYPSLLSASGSPPDPEKDGEDEEVWNDWSGMFAERGYTALEVDITAPASSSASNGTAADGASTTSPLKAMTTLLASQIRLLGVPFPPIIIASGIESGLLAQAFVEDNPASGMVLVNPPPDAGPAGVGGSGGGGGWPTFTYEPNFPILLLGPSREALESTRVGSLAKNGVNRGGKGVSLEVLKDGPRGGASRYVSDISLSHCHAATPTQATAQGVELMERRWRGGWIDADSSAKVRRLAHA